MLNKKIIAINSIKTKEDLLKELNRLVETNRKRRLNLNNEISAVSVVLADAYRMLNIILELNTSFSTECTINDQKIHCEKYGVSEEDCLKAILFGEKEYGEYEKWLKKQPEIIRYQVKDKKYLLLVENGKGLDDQKYISRAINALRKDNDERKRLVAINLQLLIGERITAMRDAPGSKKEFTQEKPQNHSLADVNGEELLVKTDNKKETIELGDNQEIKKILSGKNNQEAPIRLSNDQKTQARETEEIARKLFLKYSGFEFMRIKSILIANKNDIRKTEKELSGILFSRDSDYLRKRYFFMSETEINQVLENEGSLAEAEEILKIENTIRRNKTRGLLESQRRLVDLVADAWARYCSIYKEKGLFSLEATEALKTYSNFADSLEEKK